MTAVALILNILVDITYEINAIYFSLLETISCLFLTQKPCSLVMFIIVEQLEMFKY